MLDADIHLIKEEFHAESVSPTQMDTLWENGWRHFGTHFFRYNLGIYEFDIRRVIPLRVRLAEFSLSKSQRRVLRKNSDLKTVIAPIEITTDAEAIFARHKHRFDYGVPDSVYDFLSLSPSKEPCEAKQLSVYAGDSLIAESYFDIGDKAVSGIYAMFEPEYASRSLGIFTMLKEIEFAINSGKEFYYQGYCYDGDSFYDYKKRFRGTEAYDWSFSWEKFFQEQRNSPQRHGGHRDL
jgi:arginyl-tRNA--protein-N-Asp/Glu arginylyltransferase